MLGGGVEQTYPELSPDRRSAHHKRIISWGSANFVGHSGQQIQPVQRASSSTGMNFNQSSSQ